MNYFHPLPKPNILIITLDALRPDHLGCYGYKRNTSPNIDKLAQEGVKFTQAIVQFETENLINTEIEIFIFEAKIK